MERVSSSQEELRQMTAQIVSAYVAKNRLEAGELPQVIEAVHAALADLVSGGAAGRAAAPTPAVPIRRSVTQSYVVCLEDGKKFKTLRRHLQKAHGLTPETYRARWGLKGDYPMVAPNYAGQRSRLARKLGLGKKSGPATGRGGAGNRSETDLPVPAV